MLAEGMDAEIVSKSNASIQRTLAIIKPEALPYADEIEEKIKEDGYTIVQVQKPQYRSSND
jgi:nucleoside diphosphate kinase